MEYARQEQVFILTQCMPWQCVCEHCLSDCSGDYSYLSRAAAEVVSGRRALANSYVAAYAMPWSDRKR